MSAALALKAEVVLAVQLVSRHRAPRLVLLLVGSLVLVMLSGDADAADVGSRQRTILLVAGTLGAVAGARLLARGGPLHSARGAAASSAIPALGRLAGSLTLTGPILLAVSVAVLPAGAVLASTAAAVLLCATTTAASMALTPAMGASSAATVGFAAALFGGVPPSAVAALLDAWPPLRTPAVILWNTLPLPWRPARWLAGGSALDPWFLAAWALAAAWFAALAIERFPERGARDDVP